VHVRFPAVPVAGTLPKGEVLLPDLTFLGLLSRAGAAQDCGCRRGWLWLP